MTTQRKAKEKYPVAKGDVVAVEVRHTSAVSFQNRNVATAQKYFTLHLATVASASRQGRALKLRYPAKPGLHDAYDTFTRTMAIGTKQKAARALLATMDHEGANEFASVDHLRTAILAHDKEEAA